MPSDDYPLEDYEIARFLVRAYYRNLELVQKYTNVVSNTPEEKQLSAYLQWADKMMKLAQERGILPKVVFHRMSPYADDYGIL